MAMSIDLQRDVQTKLQQWGKEAAMYFCRLAVQDGAEFMNVQYPTGLRMVRVTRGAEKVEVPLRQAKELRAAGYKVTVQ